VPASWEEGHPCQAIGLGSPWRALSRTSVQAIETVFQSSSFNTEALMLPMLPEGGSWGSLAWFWWERGLHASPEEPFPYTWLAQSPS
jgi:hypothetical protein